MKGLVLDGGGVFGIGQALILSQCDLSKFDFIVGTSIGSVVGALIAIGNIDTQHLYEFFYSEMPKIFAGHWWRSKNFISTKYNDAELNSSLRKYFGDVKLKDVKIPLFITAANLHTQDLKVFSSVQPSDKDLTLWRVLRGAVAAPTYFEPFDGYCDGGVFANNPSMIATAAALKVLNCDIEDLELCSLGTGAPPEKTRMRNWTNIQWISWLISTFLHGTASEMHHYFVRSLPLKNYTRIQFNRHTNWSMDSFEDMKKAEKAWKSDIEHGIIMVNDF